MHAITTVNTTHIESVKWPRVGAVEGPHVLRELDVLELDGERVAAVADLHARLHLAGDARDVSGHVHRARHHRGARVEDVLLPVLQDERRRARRGCKWGEWDAGLEFRFKMVLLLAGFEVSISLSVVISSFCPNFAFVI